MALSKVQAAVSNGRRSPSPEVSIDLSTDSYRNKCQHLSETVKELHKQLKSAQIKLQGYQTISDLHREARQEIEELTSQLQLQERLLDVYKSRLLSLGASISTTVGNDEKYVPGPSKQLIDNLVKENTKLKQHLKFANCDPQQLEEALLAKRELLKRNQELEKLNLELSNQIKVLEKSLEASPQEKDILIRRLTSEIQEIQHSSLTQDVLCQSLSEETNNLKKRLKETAEECQRLAQQLGERERSVENCRKPFAGGSGQIDADVDSLKRRIAQLETQLKEVASMNQRWQNYNEQREQYVRKVQQDCSELETRLKHQHIDPTAAMSENQQKAVDAMLLKYKQKLQNAEDEKQKVEEELMAERREKVALRETVQALTARVDELEHQAQYSRASQSGDDVDILKTQIQIFKDDFEQERRDRETAQGKVHELEDELRIVKQQLEMFQRDAMTSMQRRRQEALQEYERQYYNQHNQGLVARGGNYPRAGNLYMDSNVVADGDDEDDTQEPEGGFDEIDGFDMVDGPIPQGKQSSDFLECPKCQKAYRTEQHTELLEHIDVCCD